MCQHCVFDPLDGADDPYRPGSVANAAPAYARSARLSRRDLLRLGALAGFSGAGLAALATGVGAAAVRQVGTSAVPGAVPVTMAMHVHACFSEGMGSMEAQLTEALANDVAVLWWTEHDWRMAFAMYRTQVSFDSLAAEDQFGTPWIWTPTASGAPTTTSGTIVSSPLSPKDPSQVGALEVAVSQASPTTSSAYGFLADAATLSHQNYHGNIAGLVVTIDVYPTTVTGGGYLEVLFQLAVHPARNGRPDGQYQISYRFGLEGATKIGGNRPGSRVASGLVGIVTQALPADTYTTVTMDPAADAAALWPDIDARDNNLPALYVRAGVHNGGSALGYFDNMTLSWPTLAEAVAHQGALMSKYAPSFPSITQIASQEFSRFEATHMNIFGPIAVAPPVEVGNLTLPDRPPSFYRDLCAANRAAGGITSLNHVFGVANSGPLLTGAARTAEERSVIASLIKNLALGADLFEAGYRERGAMPLESHLDAWDACSRNGIVMTGNGCNDDHEGIAGSWATKPNRFLTIVWAQSAQESDILTALATGRAFVADQTAFSGTIDLRLDDGTPMGGVTHRSTKTTRQLTVFASALPTGATVDVVAGPIDVAGPGTPAPGTSVVATLGAGQFAGGGAAVTIPTPADCFVRVNLVIPDGATTQIVAFSNPVFIANTMKNLKRVDARRTSSA